MKMHKIQAALMACAFSMALGLSLGAVTGTAHAKKSTDTSESVPKKAKKVKKPKAAKNPKASFDKGSAESPAERDKRLKRECKGRANSGLCSGYGG